MGCCPVHNPFGKHFRLSDPTSSVLVSHTYITSLPGMNSPEDINLMPLYGSSGAGHVANIYKGKMSVIITYPLNNLIMVILW